MWQMVHKAPPWRATEVAASHGPGNARTSRREEGLRRARLFHLNRCHVSMNANACMEFFADNTVKCRQAHSRRSPIRSPSTQGDPCGCQHTVALSHNGDGGGLPEPRSPRRPGRAQGAACVDQKAAEAGAGWRRRARKFQFAVVSDEEVLVAATGDGARQPGTADMPPACSEDARGDHDAPSWRTPPVISISVSLCRDAIESAAAGSCSGEFLRTVLSSFRLVRGAVQQVMPG